MSAWLEFWNGAQRLYANDRHREVHFQRVADDVIGLLGGASARVLDYGAGEAVFADRIAAAAGHLTLYEPAGGTRSRLAARYVGHARISVITAAGLTEMPDSSIDLIVVNSVLQYLSRAELDQLLVDAQRLLAPGGRLLIGDVVPPRSGMLADTASMLHYAAGEGFLGAAVYGLVATVFSPYTRIRRRVGLSCYTEPEMVALLAAAGFTARRRRPNLSHNQARLAFLATRVEPAGDSPGSGPVSQAGGRPARG
jgi:SAM-dependent methyltransferase